MAELELAAPSPTVEYSSRATSTTSTTIDSYTNEEKDEMEDWITAVTEGTSSCSVPDDYGLSKIAAHLGTSQTTAVTIYWQGAAAEQTGDIMTAMSFYKKAYRMWPALDSIYEAGLPRDVRQQADAAQFHSCDLLGVVPVADAQASVVMYAPESLKLNASDLQDIEAVRQSMTATETALMNNPQNATHEKKVCTFLNSKSTSEENKPSGEEPSPELCVSSCSASRCSGEYEYAMRKQAPHVLRKMIRFGRQAWQEAQWSGDAETPGPLYAMSSSSSNSTSTSMDCTGTSHTDTHNGEEALLVPPPLSIRVAEHWEYSVGGGLVDPLHYDVDSVLTIVALLSDETTFEGGTFRTYEADDSQLEHPMAQGDVICFVSHKYHNVVPVTKGTRCSFVMELWQGGLGHVGR